MLECKCNSPVCRVPLAVSSRTYVVVFSFVYYAFLSETRRNTLFLTFFSGGFVNREQPMLPPPTDPSSSRARRGPYRHRRRNATDLSRLGF